MGKKELKKGKKGKYALTGVSLATLIGLTAYGIVRGGNKKVLKK